MNIDQHKKYAQSIKDLQGTTGDEVYGSVKTTMLKLKDLSHGNIGIFSALVKNQRKNILAQMIKASMHGYKTASRIGRDSVHASV